MRDGAAEQGGWMTRLSWARQPSTSPRMSCANTRLPGVTLEWVISGSSARIMRGGRSSAVSDLRSRARLVGVGSQPGPRHRRTQSCLFCGMRSRSAQAQPWFDWPDRTLRSTPARVLSKALRSPRIPPPDRRSDTWRTFLRSQIETILAIDFLHVDTVLLKWLYPAIAIEIGSRRLSCWA